MLHCSKVRVVTCPVLHYAHRVIEILHPRQHHSLALETHWKYRLRLHHECLKLGCFRPFANNGLSLLVRDVLTLGYRAVLNQNRDFLHCSQYPYWKLHHRPSRLAWLVHLVELKPSLQELDFFWHVAQKYYLHRPPT